MFLERDIPVKILLLRRFPSQDLASRTRFYSLNILDLCRTIALLSTSLSWWWWSKNHPPIILYLDSRHRTILKRSHLRLQITKCQRRTIVEKKRCWSASKTSIYYFVIFHEISFSITRAPCIMKIWVDRSKELVGENIHLIPTILV